MNARALGLKQLATRLRAVLTLRNLRWALAALLTLLLVLDLSFPLPLPKSRDTSTLVVARDGTPLRAFADAEGVWRYPADAKTISPLYLQALLAYEDRWFWRHPGINPWALARAGKQMLLEGRGPGARLRIIEGNDKVNYKPCVDITFASAAKIYGDKVLAIVLTGMGADGRDGARLLKEQGATIWAQDEASCVVYGMPQAVAKAGIASESLPLDRVAQRILVELGR